MLAGPARGLCPYFGRLWALTSALLQTPPGPAVRFAAAREDSCGWLDLDGQIVGGFEPGMKNCAPPFDGKGWANTPDGWQFYDLD